MLLGAYCGFAAPPALAAPVDSTSAVAELRVEAESLDGRCPFSRAEWEAVGFRVLAFDRDDTPFARTMGKALGWNQGPSPMDLENDLFATYTMVVKPRK